MTTTYRQSRLGAELRAIVEAHPDVQPHPKSPVGPITRAVLWVGTRPWPPLKGQALWEPEEELWTVRCYDTFAGPHTTEFIHMEDKADIPDAITEIVRRFR